MEKKIRLQTEENKTKKDYIIQVKVTVLTLVLFTQYYKSHKVILFLYTKV